MNRFFQIPVLSALILLLSISAFAQDHEPCIVRPFKVEAKVSGAEVARPGSYDVSVGDYLEFEYSFPVVPDAMPQKLDFHVSNDDVLDATEPVVRDVVAPGLMGTGAKAFCFRAANPGTTTLKLRIDDNEYQYSVTVESAHDDPPEPKLCPGAFSAIQRQGRVFIFANGVHPSAGHRTMLAKAAIAIWPPQFSLTCKPPSGASAQVLSPFSAQVSFEAPDPVEAVIITDSNGQHTIKVIQF